MAYEFKLPDLGEGLTEGEIARWLVAEGQEIAEDDPLVEVQTDKTTVEIPSPAAGKVARILVARRRRRARRDRAGRDRRGRGRTRGGGGAAAGRARARPPRGASGARSHGVRATPLIRRMAQELGVDLESVEGSGPQGRITEDDVRRAGRRRGVRARAGASRCAVSAASSPST